MPDILLIQPPVQDFYLTAKRTMPYGLACIAGALRRDGFSVAILDALATSKGRAIAWPENMGYLRPHYGRSDRSPFALFHKYSHFGYSFEHIAAKARTSGAFLIGISSLCSAYSETALQTAAVVRKACPQAVIILGGHHATAMPEVVMQHPAVDYVLRGDGEQSLPLLASALRQGTSTNGVPGLVRRVSGGRAHISPPHVIRDPGEISLPAFDLIAMRRYRRYGRGALALTAGRGCPLRCTYCAVNAATHHGFRRRSVADVMKEILAADAEEPLGFIDFEDEHLTADRAWFLQLLTVLEEKFAGRLIELRAMNGLLASTLDEEVLVAMARAGFKTLNLALITTSSSQLKRFGRPDVSGDLDRVLAMSQTLGLDAVAYLIAGGPDQDPFSSVEDLLFLAQRPVLAGVSIFYPAPGSADYLWCQRRGLLPVDLGLLRATALPLEHATDRLQAVTLLRLGRMLNFMKKLADQGLPLPVPAPAPATIDPQVDRMAAGILLLAAFLHAGIIYGLDAEGKVYPHSADHRLCRAFIERLQAVKVRGVKGKWK